MWRAWKRGKTKQIQIHCRDYGGALEAESFDDKDDIVYIFCLFSIESAERPLLSQQIPGLISYLTPGSRPGAQKIRKIKLNKQTVESYLKITKIPTMNNY